MTIQDIQKSLKEKYPNLIFKVVKGKNDPRACLVGHIYHKAKDIAFDLLLDLDRHFFTIAFCFGKAKFDQESFSIINKFNCNMSSNYKAIIGHVNATKQDYLIIKYLNFIETPDQAPDFLTVSTNKILNNAEFKMFRKRIIDEIKIRGMN